MLCDFAHKSKNLYNHANYLIRHEFICNNNWIRYEELDKILKSDLEFDDYRQMPTAQSAQQILKLVDKNWKSFFKSIKDWSANPDKYLGRPKLPKYKSKTGNYILILTNQEARFRDDTVFFPKAFNGLSIKPHFNTRSNLVSLNQVRFIPDNKQFIIELVYSIKISDAMLPDNNRYLSIDIGLDNLATVVNNAGLQPVIINGKGLKSLNKYYNKKISHYRKIAKRLNNKDVTNNMSRLTFKRNQKVNDYMHKASRYIVDYASLNNFNSIVIGNNKNWKQNSVMNKNINQSFVGIPHMKLIEMLEYKAQELGINVILTDESYTSGTSFIDHETPTKTNYNNARRRKRGLFISNDGIRINADVNGAYQIMKKVFLDATMPEDIGFVLNPVVVNVQHDEEQRINIITSLDSLMILIILVAFGTDFGKGTSNNELMVQHGWRSVYDCGQMVFVKTY